MAVVCWFQAAAGPELPAFVPGRCAAEVGEQGPWQVRTVAGLFSRVGRGAWRIQVAPRMKAQQKMLGAQY